MKLQLRQFVKPFGEETPSVSPLELINQSQSVCKLDDQWMSRRGSIVRHFLTIARASARNPDGPSSHRWGTPSVRILKGAEVRAGGGLPLKCIVRDVSTTGARIERRGSIMSDFFRLSFDDLEWPQETPCEVVWRDSDAMGVKFEAPIAVPDNILAQAAD
jgi:hypothetical protein